MAHVEGVDVGLDDMKVLNCQFNTFDENYSFSEEGTNTAHQVLDNLPQPDFPSGSQVRSQQTELQDQPLSDSVNDEKAVALHRSHSLDEQGFQEVMSKRRAKKQLAPRTIQTRQTIRSSSNSDPLSP